MKIKEKRIKIINFFIIVLLMLAIINIFDYLTQKIDDKIAKISETKEYLLKNKEIYDEMSNLKEITERDFESSDEKLLNEKFDFLEQSRVLNYKKENVEFVRCIIEKKDILQTLENLKSIENSFKIISIDVNNTEVTLDIELFE